MQVVEIHLKGVCGHRDFRHQFHPGLTMITGRNGSGKSTILLALEAILTGDWSGFAGNKSENLSQFLEGREPAFARGLFRHNDVEFEIARHLRPNKAEIVVGDSRETGEKRINEIVEEILGVPLAVVSAVNFIKQLQIARFMTERPAERAETFGYLFGTAHAGRLHELLGDELSATPVLQETDEREDLRGRIAEARYRRENLADELAKLPPVEPGAAGHASGVIAAVAARKSAVSRKRELLRQLRPLVDRMQAGEDQLQPLRATRDSYVQACADMRTEVDLARQELETWQRYRRQAAARERLQAERGQVEASIARHPVPEPPSDETIALAVRCVEGGAGLSRQIQNDQEFLASFADGAAACPTCGTSAVTLAEKLEEARRRLPELEAYHLRLQTARQEVLSYESGLAQHERWLSQQRERLARIDGELTPLLSLQPPDRNEEDLKSFLVDVATFEKERDDLVRRVSSLELEAGRQEGAYAELLRQRNLIEAKLKQPRPGRADYATAVAESARLADLAARRGALEGQIAELDRQIAQGATRLVEVEAAIRRAAANNAWRELVGQLRPLFHRDGLPKLVAQTRLAEIEDEIQELLADFGAPFRIETLPDLSYRAHFEDGRIQPVARLSPGQKAILSLAFWAAVNSAFARELGFLSLDEPTDSLDEVNKACVELAINRLREISQSRGLQCLVVTHDRRLARLCDAPLDLGGW